MASSARTLPSASRPRVEFETLTILVFYGVVLGASLLLLSWSAHSGSPSSAVELDILNVMNWI
jgi:hypothetical protein